MSGKRVSRAAEIAARLPKAQLTEPWGKVTTVLYDREVIALDELCIDIRKKTGKKLNRTDLLRGILDAVLESGLDLTGATSEAEVKAAVLAAMRRKDR